MGPRILGLSSGSYGNENAPYPGHRNAYPGYIAETLARLGVMDGARRAQDILALEKQLAAVLWNGEQLQRRARIWSTNQHITGKRVRSRRRDEVARP